MAKRGGGDGWILALGAVAVMGLLYAYAQTGKGENNSPLIPDSIEDRIDRVVSALNQTFGSWWVDRGFDAVRAYVERTMPEVAWLVNALFRVEQEYSHIRNAGRIKKQAALRLVRG